MHPMRSNISQKLRSSETCSFKTQKGRVSIQGVESLWGDRVVFLRLCTGGAKTKVYLPPVSVPGAESWKNNAMPLK